MFRSNRRRDPAPDLYAAIVAQARQPAFYAELGVSDSVDGRFEMIALHVFLVLHRLKRAPQGAGLGQALFDTMFADMDRSLREMGAGDLGVGKRVKAMAESFYGRIAAYDSALAEADDRRLGEALQRNVYRGAEPVAAHVARLAAYMRASAASLGAQDDAALAAAPRFAGLDEGAAPH